MKFRFNPRVLTLILVLLAGAGFFSCASSSGGSFKRAADSERRQAHAAAAKASPEPSGTQDTPAPIVFDEVPITGWIDFGASVAPDMITANGSFVDSSRMIALPIGLQHLVFSRFGFQDILLDLLVRPDQTSPVQLEWIPAPFSLGRKVADRRDFSPRSPGGMASCRITFAFTAPGAARINVVDSQGREVAEAVLLDISRRLLTFSWNGRTPQGEVLPEGEYTVILEAVGRDGIRVHDQIAVYINDRNQSHILSLSGMGAGLLLVPFAEVLPGGGGQLSGELIGCFQDSAVRLPVKVFSRLGLGENQELDLGLGAIFRETYEASQASAMAAWRWNYLSLQSGDLRFKMALAASGRFRSWFEGDGYSSLDDDGAYPGLGVGMTAQGGAGPVEVLLGADLNAAYQYYYGSLLEDGDSVLYSYMNLRGGVGLQAEGLFAGLSAAIKTEPFGSGGRIFNPRILCGAEAHYTFAEIDLTLGASALGVIEATQGWYIYGGLSAAFAF